MIDRLLQKLRFQLDENGHIDWSLWCIDGSNIRAHVSSAGAGKKGDYLNQETTLWVVQEADLSPKSILSLMEEEPLSLNVGLTAGQAHESKSLESILKGIRFHGGSAWSSPL